MPRPVIIDTSPPIHRNMGDILDRDAFRKSIPILAARVEVSKTNVVVRSPVMKHAILDLPKVKSVQHIAKEPEGDRLVLLKAQSEADLSPEQLDFLKTESKGILTHTLDLDYGFWTADEILQAALPEELCPESPTGFATTGHIAHMNLNDEYLPYKHLIGQVILDKNNQIQTVVNKLHTIHNQFRFFDMELIAGKPEYIVEHHETDCRFTFDFTKVYWNSRLHTEHERLIKLFRPDDVVADVFAGVGPFAVPAAKKGCAVFANDLNPNSEKYLSKNIQDNRVTDLVRASCEDGRDFIRAVTARALERPFPPYIPPVKKPKKADRAVIDPPTAVASLPPPRRRISHFVMNLPDSAIEFLDAFRGILSSVEGSTAIYDTMPMVHCYCFTREMEADKADVDIRQRVHEKLGSAVTEEVSLHYVRSVARGKDMYCISFRLPVEVAFAK